jgi:carboxymethylenebutenolidase
MAFEVTTATLRLPTFDGRETTAFVAAPSGPGPFPAVVFGAEAMGPNRFGRRVASELAALGYVTITPDYYRGAGPSRSDDYSDFTEVMAAIDGLDFRAATFDVLAGVDWARRQLNVAPDRVALWGYCTGATLTWMAAALDRHVAATVLFFPSQPTFEVLTPKRPVHAMDLIWAVRGPVMLFSGDQDAILPAPVLDEMRVRFAQHGVKFENRLYAGAGHAFSAEAPHMHNAAAAADSWARATAFLGAELGPPGARR